MATAMPATLLAVFGALAAVSAAGCDSKPKGEAGQAAVEHSPTNSVDDTAYTRDIERICNAERHSGAIDEPEPNRPMIVAQWLARSIETDKGRALSVRIRSLSPAEKVNFLDDLARKHSLSECLLADRWRAEAAKAATPEAPPTQ